MTEKSIAKQILESVPEVLGESVLTKQDMPDFDKVVDKVLVTGNVLHTASPGVHVVNLDGHTLTVSKGNSAGADPYITGNEAGINHVKALSGTITNGN